MSSRVYPMYRRGNPQLRIYLPNFWMKLVKPDKITHAPNKVQFIVSSEMTQGDVRQYLEKIYNVPVMDVKTYNHATKVEESKRTGDLYKEEDYKVAFVTLPKDYLFEFPDIIKEKEKAKKEKTDQEQFKRMKTDFAERAVKITGRKGAPSFFGL